MILETTRARLGRNVAWMRGARGMTIRELSARCTELGHRIAPSSITKIELGHGTTDADQLVVLALALRTTPNRLLLPERARGDAEVALTESVTATEDRVWHWALGGRPLKGMYAEDAAPGDVSDDFVRHCWPPELNAGREQDEAFDAAQKLIRAMEAAHGRPYQFTMDESGVRIEPTDLNVLWAEAVKDEQTLRVYQERVNELRQERDAAPVDDLFKRSEAAWRVAAGEKAIDDLVDRLAAKYHRLRSAEHLPREHAPASSKGEVSGSDDQ